MKQLNIIAAVADNYAIGLSGKIPWHLPEDLRLFRTLTMGHAVIMGRRTFESLGRPLPNRTNIVISRDSVFNDVQTTRSIEDAITLAHKYHQNAFIIGGAQLYAQALDVADNLYISHIHQMPNADTFFPRVDFSTYDLLVERAFNGFTVKQYGRQK